MFRKKAGTSQADFIVFDRGRPRCFKSKLQQERRHSRGSRREMLKLPAYPCVRTFQFLLVEIGNSHLCLNLTVREELR